MKRRTMVGGMLGGLLGGLGGAIGATPAWNPPPSGGAAVLTDDEVRGWDPASEDSVAPYRLTARQIDLWLGVDWATVPPRRSIRVVYFHRTPGCETCRKMAKYVCETLRSEEFLPAMRERRVSLRFVDFEKPRDDVEKAMVREFRVTGPSLVLMLCESADEDANPADPDVAADAGGADRVMGGKTLDGRTLERAWLLAPRQAAFQEYVARELRRFLPRTAEK